MPGIPVISRTNPNASAPAQQAGSDNKMTNPQEWDTKDWTLAGGVGATVCVVTGAVTMGTLALVGIGAGVGYSAGQWIVDKMAEKEEAEAAKKGLGAAQRLDQLHPAAQASLGQWQTYLGARGAGCQLTAQGVGQIFAEFEQREPGHAANVRACGTPAIMQAIQDAAGISVVHQATDV